MKMKIIENDISLSRSRTFVHSQMLLFEVEFSLTCYLHFQSPTPRQEEAFQCYNKLQQDHLRMNVAPNRTIIIGLQIVLDYRSLSSIGQKILMILLPPSPTVFYSSSLSCITQRVLID